MVRLFFIFSYFLISLTAVGQDYSYHRAVTIKTNILSLIHLAVEFPVYHRLTSEVGFKYMQYTVNSSILSWNEDRIKHTIRANIKYHFPMEDNRGKYYSAYIFTGINKFYNKVTYDFNERGLANVSRITLGGGTKRRRYDLWIGCEKILYTRSNNYYEQSTSNNLQPKRWLPDIYVSGGIAINLINIKLR